MSIGFGFFLFSIIFAFLNTLFSLPATPHCKNLRCGNPVTLRRQAKVDGEIHYAILGVLRQFFLILKPKRDIAATRNRIPVVNQKIWLRVAIFVSVGSFPGRIVSITPL